MGTSHRQVAAFTGLVVMALIASGAIAASTNVAWLGGTGTWGNAALWAGGVVPNNGATTYAVFIDGGNAVASTVELNFPGIATTTIDSLTLDANDTLNIDNSNRLNIAAGGTISNAGTINLGSTGSFTNLNVPNVTLSGGGVIHLGGNPNNYIRVQTPMARFTNLDNRIRGSGTFGGDQAMQFTNSGTIQADQPVPMRIIPGFESSNINTGWIGAINAQLFMNGSCTLDNTGGIIEAAGGSISLQNRFRISGGTIQTSAGGVLRADGSSLYPRLSDITNRGYVLIPASNGLELAGTINNIGSIVIAQNTATLQIAGDTTLTGGGSLNFEYLNSNLRGTAAGDRLINEDNLIYGVGSLGMGSIKFTNRGTVRGTSGRGLWIGVSGDATNDTTGLWQAATGGFLSLAQGSFINNGSIQVESGGTMSVNAPLTGNGIHNDGVLRTTSTVSIDHITGAGSTTVFSTGSLTVNRIRGNALSLVAGDAAINPNGGPNGTSVLAGLAISGGSVLDLADNYLIVDYMATSVLGDITTYIADGRLTSSLADATHVLGYADNASLNLTSFGGVATNSTSVLVRYTYLGDANLDGQVDITDLASLATNWQTSGSWENGDFDRNGVIDIADLALLATNWQAGVPAPTALSLQQALAEVGFPGAAVPEPVTSLLASIGALLLRRRR